MEAEALKQLGRRWPSRIIVYIGDYPMSTFSDILTGLEKRHGYCPRRSFIWDRLNDNRRAGLIKTWRPGRKLGRPSRSSRHRYTLSSIGDEGYRILTGGEPGPFPQES